MFGKSRQVGRPVADGGESDDRGVVFAWRTHTAITDWTAKVDSKAAIVLSIGGALLGFFVTLSAKGRALSGLHGWHLWGERAGLAVTAGGVLLSVLVVAPRLNRRVTKNTWKQNFIFFGHLRYWAQADLKAQLRSLDADHELDMLATQLIRTADIAWYKHSVLQYSMAALVLGVSIIAIAVLF